MKKPEEITTQKKQPVGEGYGRKTWENLARDIDIPVQDILEFLRSKGIDAQKNEVIRNIVEKNGLKAYELVEMIQKIKE